MCGQSTLIVVNLGYLTGYNGVDLIVELRLSCGIVCARHCCAIEDIVLN